MVLVYGSSIAHFLRKYRIKHNVYPPRDLKYLDKYKRIRSMLKNNLPLNVTKLTPAEIVELSKIIFKQLYMPFENLEFSDFADDKSTVPDAGVMLDNIIKEKRLHKTGEGRLLVRLLKLQKGEHLRIVKELDEGKIPTEAFFVQGCIKENEVSTKGGLFVVVHFQS